MITLKFATKEKPILCELCIKNSCVFMTIKLLGGWVGNLPLGAGHLSMGGLVRYLNLALSA